MSNVIDERVVEMQFDNKEFEKNIATSIESLEELKKSLKFEDTSSNIDKITQSLDRIDFDKLNKAADAIQKKFSVLGTIVDQTIRRITDKSLNMFESVVDRVLTGGQNRAAKLANARFTLQGFLKGDDGKELDRIMKSVSESVSGTAYGLDAAASVASQLIPTGIDGGEQLLKVLQGIAGTAAMTNSSFEDIGHIFTTVAAKGRLMGDQINQFSYRGLNVAEVLAQQIGVTSEEIIDMVSKGKISFEMFSKAMANAFGEHAYKANETYSGSLANLYSALSRIGEPIQAARMNAMKGIFNSTRVLVNKINEAMKPFSNSLVKTIELLGKFAVKLLDDERTLEIVQRIVGSVTNVMHVLGSVLVQVASAFLEVFPETSLNRISNFFGHVEEFTRSLIVQGETAKLLRNFFVGVFKVIKGVVKISWQLFKALEPIFSILGQILKVGLLLLSYIGDLLSAIADSLATTGVLTAAIEMVAKVLEHVAAIIIGVVVTAITAVGNAFSFLWDLISPLIKAIGDFGAKIREIFANSTNVIEGFFNVVEYVFREIQNKFGAHGNKLFAGIFRTIANGFKSIANFYKGGFEIIFKFFDFMLSGKGIALGFAAALIFLSRIISRVSGGFLGIIADTRGLIGDIRAQFVTNNMLKVAVAFGIVATSISLLAMAIDKVDAKRLVSIAIGMAALMAATAYLSGQVGIGRSRLTNIQALLAFTLIIAAIVTIVHGISEINKIQSLDQVIIGLGLVGTILVLFGVIATIINRIPATDNKTIASGVLALSVSLYAIASSLEKLTKIDINSIGPAVAAMMGVLVLLSAMSYVLYRMSSTNPIRVGSFIGTLLAMVFTLVTITSVTKALIKAINELDYDHLKEGLEKLKGYKDYMYALGVVLVGIGVIGYSVGPILRGIGSILMSLAAGAIALSYATRMLAESFRTDPETTQSALIAIGLMSLVVTAIATAATAFVSANLDRNYRDFQKSLNAFGKIIWTVAGTATLLSAVVAVFSLIKDPESIIVGAAAIAGVVLAIGFVVSQIAKVKPDENSVNAIKAVSKIIGMLSILLGSFVVLDSLGIDVTKGLISGLASIAVILTSIIGIIIALDGLKIDSDTSKSIGYIVKVINMLAVTLIALSLMTSITGSWTEVAAATGAIIAILASLSIVMSQVRRITGLRINPNTLKTLRALNGVILGLSGIVAVMSAVSDTNRILSSGAVIAGIIVLMVRMALNLSKLQHISITDTTIRTINTLGGIIGAIGLVTTALATLGKDAVTIIAAGASMSALISLLILLITKLDKLQHITINKNVIKTLIVVGSVITAVGAVVALISAIGQNWGMVLTAAGSLVLVTAALGGVVIALSKFATTTIPDSVIVTLGVLGVAVGLMAFPINAIMKYGANAETMLSAAVSLSLLIGTMGIIVTLLSNLSKDSKSAIIGAVGVAGIALALTPLANSLNGLAGIQTEVINETLMGFVKILGTIGIIIAVLGLIGSSGQGALGLAVAALGISAIALSLSVLANSITGLLTVVGGFSSSVEPLKKFVDLSSQLPNAVAEIAATIGSLHTSVYPALELVINDFKEFNTQLAAELDATRQILENKMQSAGTFAALGYSKGISARSQEVNEEVAKMVLGGAVAAMEAQKSHSPSLLYALIGQMAGLGYGEGIETTDIADSIGTFIVNAISNITEHGADFQAAGSVIGSYFGQGFLDSASGLVDGLLANLASKFADGAPIESDTVVAAKKKIEDNKKKEEQKKSNKQKIADRYEWQRRQREAAASYARTTKGKTDIYTAAAANYAKSRQEKEYVDSVKTNTKVQGDYNNALDQLAIKLGLVRNENEEAKKTTDELTTSMNEFANSLGGAGGTGGVGGAAKAAQEEMQSLIVTSEELHDSLKQTIDSQIDMFSKFEKKTELTGAEVIENMRSQIEGVTEWAENLDQLAKRGVNKALLQELSKLGPAGYEKVNAFVTMSDEQLAEANELYAKRLALPEAASSYIVDSFAQAGMWTGEGFLTGLTPYVGESKDMATRIAEATKEGIYVPLGIHSPSAVMYDYGTNVGDGLVYGIKGRTNAVKKAATDMAVMVITSMRHALNGTSVSGTSSSTFASFTNAITNSVDPMVKEVVAFCDRLISEMDGGLPDETFYNMGARLIEQIDEGITKTSEQLIIDTLKVIEAMSKKVSLSFSKIGEFAADGMSKGIESKIKKVSNSVVKVCKATISSAEKTLKENSPSKVFYDIGSYIPIGLANGIISKIETSKAAIDDVSSVTIGRFQNAISKIRNSVDSSDGELTLRPVLDTSNVEDGLTRINTMFENRSYSIDANIRSIRNASNAYERARAVTANAQNADDKQPQTINNYTTFNQTNNSPQALSNAEIYRRTNNLISRMKGE